MSDQQTVGSTVIIPSYNRPDRLERCLKAVMAQEDRDFEVVVVDDGSSTPLAEICSRFGPQVRCIRQENAGAGLARNRGVVEARAEFLAFTDDDCLPRPDWLGKLRVAHAGDPSRLVGGYVVNGLPDNIYSSTSQDLCDYIYEYFGASEGRISFFTTNNMGCSKDAFLAIDGFDPTFPGAGAEDRDFGMRWRESGRHLHYVPDALVDHYHHMSFASFLRQHRNYGRGARILHKQLNKRNSPTPKVEPFRFYRELVLWPLRKYGLAGARQSFLMGLTQVAMIAGYGKSILDERRGAL
ncbi:MAG: glycosyltransferase [Pseudomonadota bacterium]